MSVHLTFILIHFHFAFLYLCLLSSIRFGSVWRCAVCSLFLFYFVLFFCFKFEVTHKCSMKNSTDCSVREMCKLLMHGD